MHNRYFQSAGLIVGVMLTLQLAGCPIPVEWPIAKEVFTTTEQQIFPVAVPPGAPQLALAAVSQYEKFGYGAWVAGPGTNYSLDPNTPQPYDKRTELAPGHVDAPNAARLLSFFTMSDIHLADKESPAMTVYAGSSTAYGASINLGTYYSPTFLATTQVLDAAVQTINVLHKRTPFDFGISLGDDANNTQYNELRWFIDVLDGKVITPSSGAHAGACTIDYQKPYKAAGLDKEIPWYQAVGNHDQFWQGGAYEDIKTMQAHVGNAVFNMSLENIAMPASADTYGAYMGVIDGATPYGDVIKAGPEDNFDTPPTVVADPDRRTLATFDSSTLNWMGEFFDTTSKPVGHGFTQANLDNDFACYSFAPKADLPLKIIVLDDTVKGTGQANYAAGGLDEARRTWLMNELDEGQNNAKLMIIAAHIPILPQMSMTDTTIIPYSALDDPQLLSDLHAYPNLLLWISGHRHVNVVTPQPSPDANAPEQGFWEVETPSLRDFPQQFRTFDIRRNTDNTISIFVTDVVPAFREGSPAAKSRAYAIATAEIFQPLPFAAGDPSTLTYNAELVKQLTPEMQAIIAHCGTPIE